MSSAAWGLYAYWRIPTFLFYLLPYYNMICYQIYWLVIIICTYTTVPTDYKYLFKEKNNNTQLVQKTGYINYL